MQENFENSNLYFVASAVSYGSVVERTENRNGRIFFQLNNCPGRVHVLLNGEITSEAVRDFQHLFHLFNSRCLMLLPTYPNTLKDIKSLLYDRADYR